MENTWGSVRYNLEVLVKGTAPKAITDFQKEQMGDSSNYPPKLEIISEKFSRGANTFLKNTETIDNFSRGYSGESAISAFIGNMRKFEAEHPNRHLKSPDVDKLFSELNVIRDKILEEVPLENDYKNLRIGNFVSHFKIVLGGLAAMFICSVFGPLILLFSFPENGVYQANIGNYLLELGVDSISFMFLMGFVISFCIAFLSLPFLDSHIGQPV